MPCFGENVVIPLDENGVDTRNADQILDDYLKSESYFSQTFKSIDTAASSVWKKQVGSHAWAQYVQVSNYMIPGHMLKGDS